MDAVLCGLDSELLATPMDSPFVARPGAGEVKEGSLVVAVQDSPGLVRGLVHMVITVQSCSCTLWRLVGGQELRDERGRSNSVPVGTLAVAGEPLGATPLHLACLFGCSGAVLAAMGERNPMAYGMLDKHGRTPLAIAAAVSMHI